MNKDELDELPRPVVPLACLKPPQATTCVAAAPRVCVVRSPGKLIVRTGRFGTPVRWCSARCAWARNKLAPPFAYTFLDNFNNRHQGRNLLFTPNPNYCDACVAIHCAI